ncbi:MAG: exported protein of unknown function [Moraxellaceae bacterium]|jgi:uncharacterized protein YegJ (DUF2314 family)|nr:exported protein of unknown function [Moraxellaceae bacterium]
MPILRRLVLLLTCALAAIPALAAQDSRIISFEFAVYFPPGHKGDPIAVADRLLREQFPRYRRVEKLDQPPQQPVVALRLTTRAKEDYSPPDLDQLHYFGYGLSRAEAEALQGSQKALILDFAYPAAVAASGMPDALALTELIARQQHGFIWDEETRETYSAAEWKKRRRDTWSADGFDVQDHIVIHAYKSGEYIRAISLGMAKFGQPDIVINDFSWSNQRPMGNLLNLTAQSLVEGARPDTQGRLRVDLTAIRHRPTRERILASLLPNAGRRVDLQLKAAKAEEGDPRNRLVEIDFSSQPGRGLPEKQDHLVTTLFGSQDEVAHIRHDEAILAASQAAKGRLPALRSAFRRGLAPGEYLMVKAPFTRTDGGREWMWVEVMSWADNGRILGLLRNQPQMVPALKAGAEVTVQEQDVFDYLRHHADGREEGNETGKLLQQAQR